MSTSAALKSVHKIKEPKNLSERITWLRDYYYKGVDRAWNNEFTAWTTGTPWDVQFDEMTFYIVPETYPFLQTFRSCMQQAARPVKLHPDFWKWSLVERKAWFVKEVMVNYVPAGDPAGRPHCRRALQPPDVQVLDKTGGKASRQAHLRQATARVHP